MRIGIAGLGTVGASLAGLLSDDKAKDTIFSAAQERLTLQAVSARTRGRDRGVDLSNIEWVDDPLALAGHGDIDVFVELMGGADGLAKESVETALRSGKHVVTANKALLAKHGVALAGLASDNGVALRFEAAVAGSIPIIATLREGISAAKISSLRGILNGTCNYILSQMEQQAQDYHVALSDAQELGYAEAEPTLDVGGHDSAHKLAILCAIAFGVMPQEADLDITGIENVGGDDIFYASEMGHSIRLLGIASYLDGTLNFSVKPCLVLRHASFANVAGANNHIEIISDLVPTMSLTGPGAGAGPTATAVAGDVLALSNIDTKTTHDHAFGRLASRLKTHKASKGMSDNYPYYVRINTRNVQDVLTGLGQAGIGFTSPIEKNTSSDVLQGVTQALSPQQYDEFETYLDKTISKEARYALYPIINDA